MNERTFPMYVLGIAVLGGILASVAMAILRVPAPEGWSSLVSSLIGGLLGVILPRGGTSNNGDGDTER